MRIIFLILVLMISIELQAQENAFLTPMGAYEGIAGNTGIGRDGSVGSGALTDSRDLRGVERIFQIPQILIGASFSVIKKTP